MEEALRPVPAWTLVTSHGLVLLYVVAYPDSTMRAIAQELGLTERRVVDIINDLENARLLKITHEGRRNHYALDPQATFLHPVISHISFADFVELWKISAERAQEGSSSV